MRNLKCYELDILDFHLDIVNSKKNTKEDSLYKSRLNSLTPIISSQYSTYEVNFKINKLQEIKSLISNDNDKKDLIKLYNYKGAIIQQLKKNITTTATNRIINTCQNCTINSINSFDHILPKEDYSEFIVNPLNLFPSCTECNSLKGKFWIKDGDKLFLNLYLDILPNKQYLFVDISYSSNTFKTNFYLDNRNNIGDELFSLVKRHYDKLRLCNRFSENIDIVIPRLINQIKAYKKSLDLVTILDTVNEQCDENKKIYGFNYWQSVLELELIRNNDFLNLI